MCFGGLPCDSRAEVAPRLQFRTGERAMRRRGIAGCYSGIYVLPPRLSLKGKWQWSTDLSGGVCVPEGRGDLRVGTVGTGPRGRRQSGGLQELYKWLDSNVTANVNARRVSAAG
jgi:hypothetical protein